MKRLDRNKLRNMILNEVSLLLNEQQSEAESGGLMRLEDKEAEDAINDALDKLGDKPIDEYSSNTILKALKARGYVIASEET